MKWVHEMKDIEKLESDLPMEMTGYLKGRFYELMRLYQDERNTFSLKEYGGIALVESYEEIASLVFEEAFTESYEGMDFLRCVYVPNNDTCIDFCVPVAVLSAHQQKDLLDNVL